VLKCFSFGKVGEVRIAVVAYCSMKYCITKKNKNDIKGSCFKKS